jgi:hypothetical protein
MELFGILESYKVTRTACTELNRESAVLTEGTGSENRRTRIGQKSKGD